MIASLKSEIQDLKATSKENASSSSTSHSTYIYSTCVHISEPQVILLPTPLQFYSNSKQEDILTELLNQQLINFPSTYFYPPYLLSKYQGLPFCNYHRINGYHENDFYVLK